jgi:adenylosuccinate lyase
VAVAHTSIALQSTRRGISRLEPDRERLAADLDENWEVLAEAVQTVMRRYGLEKPYEKLKELTRGRIVDQQELARFIESLQIPPDARATLEALSPSGYTGNAAAQAGEC